jgi:F-type H+-transporting ATPase subunit b
MDKLIDALGLNVKILIAQIVNFVLLLAILYKVGYKPIMKFVDERTKKIETGLKNAEEATESLKNAQNQQEAILEKAQNEAQAIIKEAKSQAADQANAIMEKNAAGLRAIAEKAKKDIAAEREVMLRETRDAATVMVLQVAEKLLKEKMTDAKDKEYVEKTLASMK